MRKPLICILISAFVLLTACSGNLTMSDDSGSEFSEINDSSAQPPEAEPDSSYDDVTCGQGSYNRERLSGTDAVTERFTMYDVEGTETLVTYDDCKYHKGLIYYSYIHSEFLKDVPDEEINKFVSTFWLGNEVIDNIKPVCEGFNLIQMMFFLEITADVIDANRINENGADTLDYYTKDQIKTFYLNDGHELTDKDINLLNIAWKSEFCVYANRAYYSLEWLFENDAGAYKVHNLPVDQLEEINNFLSEYGYLTVEMREGFREKIKQYKNMA